MKGILITAIVTLGSLLLIIWIAAYMDEHPKPPKPVKTETRRVWVYPNNPYLKNKYLEQDQINATTSPWINEPERVFKEVKVKKYPWYAFWEAENEIQPFEPNLNRKGELTTWGYLKTLFLMILGIFLFFKNIKLWFYTWSLLILVGILLQWIKLGFILNTWDPMVILVTPFIIFAMIHFIIMPFLPEKMRL